MDFYAILDQIVDLLRSRERVTYRLLKRQFNLDDAALNDLKDELFFTHPQIADEDGRGFVWTRASRPETGRALRRSIGDTAGACAAGLHPSTPDREKPHLARCTCW